jgi:hypothetical protein
MRDRRAQISELSEKRKAGHEARLKFGSHCRSNAREGVKGRELPSAAVRHS